MGVEEDRRVEWGWIRKQKLGGGVSVTGMLKDLQWGLCSFTLQAHSLKRPEEGPTLREEAHGILNPNF